MDNIVQTLDLQANCGNRCGFDRNNLKFFNPPEEHKTKSWLIRKTMRRLERLVFNPYGTLVHLLLLNPSYRKKRLERLEAICCVAQVLVYYTDFRTMQVAVPQKGRADDLHAISAEKIVEVTGLRLRRVKRALGDLIKAKYLDVKRRCKEKGGKYTSIPSLKSLNKKFWYHLGIKEKALKAIKEYKDKIFNHSQSQQILEVSTLVTNEVSNIRKHIKQDTEKIPRKLVTFLTKKFF
jgi:hypothetical protein